MLRDRVRTTSGVVVVLTALLAGSAALVPADAVPSSESTARTGPVALPATATARRGSGFALDLSGEWRFQTGDDAAWRDPAYDDSGWETVQVPEEGGQDVFDSYDGYAWFRLTFRLPRRAKGVPLVAALGSIDDADVTYLNGRRIGRTGEFPPDEDSQWFEQRLYPVPADVPRYGRRNTLAVRMNDFTGGGGWFRGPVGLFSKESLRSELYGLDTSPARRWERRAVLAVLDRQARALREGRLRAYRRTLRPGFFHDGDTRQRRMHDLRTLSRRYGPLRLQDTEVQVLRDDRSGALIADVNRQLVGTRAKGKRIVLSPLRQDFLYFTGSPKRERGNRSRFFLDSVRSRLEKQERQFAVYLPPSYLRWPDRTYPTVYLLHGINGGAAEWDTRDLDRRLDRFIRRKGLAEMIVVMPDGESLWYVDSSESPWRSMFVEEMLPTVDRWYRTKPRRGMRGLSGVSMGGHGAFTIGWSHPRLFSSIATHMGALDFPPLAGTPDEVAANSDEAPTVQVTGHSTEFLQRFAYYFDACEFDDFGFDDAARLMSSELTGKGVEHETHIYPEGIHNDACWVPHLLASFSTHSDSFRAHGLG